MPTDFNRLIVTRDLPSGPLTTLSSVARTATRTVGQERGGWLVVHLEGQRERRMPGELEPAHHPVASHGPRRAHRVVVEPPRHRSPAHRRGQLARRFETAGGVPYRLDGVCFREHGAQRLAEL